VVLRRQAVMSVQEGGDIRETAPMVQLLPRDDRDL
jgi:hypothetical protein